MEEKQREAEAAREQSKFFAKMREEYNAEQKREAAKLLRQQNQDRMKKRPPVEKKEPGTVPTGGAGTAPAHHPSTDDDPVSEQSIAGNGQGAGKGGGVPRTPKPMVCLKTKITFMSQAVKMTRRY